MGLGGELPVASTLVSESVKAHERGRIVVLLESFWAVGWLIAALIAYFIIPDYGWRMAYVIERTTRSLCTLFAFKVTRTQFHAVIITKIVYLFANQWH